MQPSASFSNNTRPGCLKPYAGNFVSSSTYQSTDRFTITNKPTTTTTTKPTPLRKTTGKSKSDLNLINNFSSKTLNSKKVSQKPIFATQKSITSQSSITSESKHPSQRPTVVSKTPHASTPTLKSSSQSRVHLRNQSQNPNAPIASYRNQDENLSINKIPLSPISMKRAASPQMRGDTDDQSDVESLWTESSALDHLGSQGILSPHFASNYNIMKSSVDINDFKLQKQGHHSNKSTPYIVTAMQFDSMKSLTDTINPKTLTNVGLSPKASTCTLQDTMTPSKKATEITNNVNKATLPQFPMLPSSQPYRLMTDMNNKNRTTPPKSMHSIMNSEFKDGTLKSPGRSKREQTDFPLKPRSNNIDTSDQVSLKTSVLTLQSPPKGRLTSSTINEDSKNTSTLDGVKAYLSKLNKIDLSISTGIFKQIFQPKKRLKCSCEMGLDENQTCSRAMAWINKKYNPSEFGYLKSTYERILSENKLVKEDQSRQIQKDLHRTYPQNKFFAENSIGIKALEKILNTFAKYDPQIGYVQGMNFIAASLLYHAEEYLAFWLLVMIFEIFEMRDIYLPKLPGLSKHCQIIDMLIFNYQPSIYMHLCQHEIRVDVFCTEWILALFASVIPVENMANFYDKLLGEGWPFFYKIILAFLQHFEKQIKEQDDLIGILTVLKSQNHIIKNSNKTKDPMSIDWNTLFQKAQKIEIDSHFIYKMHSNFDVDNQWFRTSFLENK